MIGTADIHKAINTVWDASSLESLFTAYWESGVSEFDAINDQIAPPGQPFPYCIFEAFANVTTGRMSGCSDTIREIRNHPLTFRVHARRMSGESQSEKEIAASLAEEIMKVYGGHPDVKPQALVLDNGNFLIATYQNDFGTREGEDEYAWTVSYILKVDVSVQALTA